MEREAQTVHQILASDIRQEVGEDIRLAVWFETSNMKAMDNEKDERSER